MLSLRQVSVSLSMHSTRWPRCPHHSDVWISSKSWCFISIADYTAGRNSRLIRRIPVGGRVLFFLQTGSVRNWWEYRQRIRLQFPRVLSACWCVPTLCTVPLANRERLFEGPLPMAGGWCWSVMKFLTSCKDPSNFSNQRQAITPNKTTESCIGPWYSPTRSLQTAPTPYFGHQLEPRARKECKAVTWNPTCAN